MRAREFLMKDAYSFHTSAGSGAGIPEHVRHLCAHLHALGLKFRAVKADSGAIGGSVSHEFHVLAESGEDAIAFSDAARLRGQPGTGGSLGTHVNALHPRNR